MQDGTAKASGKVEIGDWLHGVTDASNVFISVADKAAGDVGSLLLGPKGTPVKLVISKDTRMMAAKEDIRLRSTGPQETVEIPRGTQTDPAGVGIFFKKDFAGPGPWLVIDLAPVRRRDGEGALGSGCGAKVQRAG